MKHSNGALEKRAAAAITFVMTEYMATSIIDDAESRMIKHNEELEKLTEPIKEAKEKLDKLQQRYDTLMHKKNEDQQLIDVASRQKNGVKRGVAFRTIRSTSHNDMRANEAEKLNGKKVQQFTWTKFAVDVLTEKNEMIEPEQLYNLVDEKFGITKRFDELQYDNSKRSSMKWGGINACWLKVCEGAKAGYAKAKLFEHNGMIGLIAWATDDFKPKAEYVKKLQKAS